MDDYLRHPRSELFMVRAWAEEIDPNHKTEWRGYVQHVISGKSRYFRDWAGLTDFLEEVLTSAHTHQDANR